MVSGWTMGQSECCVRGLQPVWCHPAARALAVGSLRLLALYLILESLWPCLRRGQQPSGSATAVHAPPPGPPPGTAPAWSLGAKWGARLRRGRVRLRPEGRSGPPGDSGTMQVSGTQPRRAPKVFRDQDCSPHDGPLRGGREAVLSLNAVITRSQCLARCKLNTEAAPQSRHTALKMFSGRSCPR